MGFRFAYEKFLRFLNFFTYDIINEIDMFIFNNLTKSECEKNFVEMGEQAFRGRQLFQGIHKNQENKISDLTNLSKSLREKLEEKGTILTNEIIHEMTSKVDGTKKFLIALEDGHVIETVFMPYHNRSTLCVSTQIGCKMGCEFCASTKSGFVRNLKAYEILNQIYLVEKYLNEKITNIVLMGIGEPLDNLEEVLKFIEILTDPDGRDFSIRNITISTVGIVPGILELGKRELPINLTLSLHHPIDEERVKIIPTASTYPLKEILEAMDYFYEKTHRRIAFEYTLIHEENDSKDEALEMAKLLKGKNAFVNLIPLNPIKEFDSKASSHERIENFKKILESNGIQTTIRQKMGEDIEGACGQLRREYLNL